jgi:hypothetical protein
MPQTLLWAGSRQQMADDHSRVVALCPFNFLRASNIDRCGGVNDGRFALPMGRSMEYRGVEYTIVRDERGDWQWAVSLGNPETIQSGHATSKGAAVIKVWAAIDRTHRKVSCPNRPWLANRSRPYNPLPCYRDFPVLWSRNSCSARYGRGGISRPEPSWVLPEAQRKGPLWRQEV